MLIISINTGRNVTRRLQEETAYSGALNSDKQVPSREEEANVYQRPANSPPLMDEYIRGALIQIA